MTRLLRGGFTLVELLVALVLGGLVLSSVMAVTLAAIRSNDRTRDRLRQQALFRESAGLLARELAGIDPATDLGAWSSESLTVRALRGTGRTCGTDGGAIAVAMDSYRAWRLPDHERDSLRIMLSTTAGTPWITAALRAGVTRGRCRDGAPALRLPVDGTIVSAAALADLPVRIVEWMRVRLYASGGEWWLGTRSLRPGDATQPTVGPFMVRGLEFGLVDGAGTAVSAAGAVRSVVLTLRGGDARLALARRGSADSATAWIAVGR